jgi:hypothetical protein
MNAPVSAMPLPTSLKPGQVLVVGRLSVVKKIGQIFAHLIVMPAPDAYSSPATVEVISKTRQGQPDEDIRLLCRLGGYRRSYKSLDRETGESRQVVTADNKLFVVED